MSELLDSRADVSYIAGKDWPSSWPTHTTENELGGLEKVVCGVGTLQKKR